MAPSANVFFEGNDHKSSDANDIPVEAISFVPPTVSTISITDLPALKKVTCFTRFSGIIYTLISSFFFTCAAFSIKLIGVDIIDALFFRFILQTALSFIFALYKRYSLFPGTIKEKFFQILCCATGAASFFFYFFAIRYIELSDVTTLCYTRVVWTVLFGICAYHERPSISLLIALPMTLLGVVFVTQPSFFFGSSIVSNSSSHRVLGLTLAILSSFSSAVNVLSFKQLVSTSKDIKPSVINFHYCLSILIFLIGNQFYERYFHQSGLTFQIIFTWKYFFASLICLVMMVTNILTQKAIKREHPAIFTLLTSADIIFALILQNLFTNKHSNFYALLGSALVIISVLIIGLARFWNDRRIQKKNAMLEQEFIEPNC